MYALTAILQKVAIMEAAGVTHNAACIEAVKTMYPQDYNEILAICKENGLNPKTEIPALIDALEAEKKQEIKAAAEELAMTKKTSPERKNELEGYEKLAVYARRPA